MPSENIQGGKDNGKLVLKENQPDSVAKALKVCDMDLYPNIYVLLKILRTLAVT